MRRIRILTQSTNKIIRSNRRENESNSTNTPKTPFSLVYIFNLLPDHHLGLPTVFPYLGLPVAYAISVFLFSPKFAVT